MNLKDRLNEDMKESMKAKQSLRLSTIRMLKAAIKNEEIAKMKELDDEGIIPVIQREIKKRKEASEEFRKAGREELSQKEEEESRILLAYLPQQASDEEIRAVVTEIVKGIPEGTKINMGLIMPKASAQLKGKAEGRRISTIAQEFINK